MSASKLVRPNIDYKESYLEALKEYHEEGSYLEKKYDDIENNFEDYIQRLNDPEINNEKKLDDWVDVVPQTILWLVKDSEYYGTLNIRHRTNWHLERWGGHISFIIRPSLRGMGFGKKILQKALPVANALGIDKALLTVPVDNVAANRIVEFCDGEKEDCTSETDRFQKCNRYWINCT